MTEIAVEYRGGYRFLDKSVRYLSILAIALLLTRDAFAAGVRYYANNFGLPDVWFAVDAAGFAAIAALTLRAASSGRYIQLSYIPITCLYYILGFLNTGSELSALSGLKALMPLLLGYLYASNYHTRWNAYPLYVVIFLFSSISILLDYYFIMPWEGANYEVFGLSRSTYKVWTTGGFDRLAGLAFDSNSAAIAVFISFAGIIRRFKAPVALAIAALAGYSIFLSTSRTALFIFGLFIVLNYSDRIFPSQRISRLAARVALVAMLASPVIASLLVYDIETSSLPFWLQGLNERIQSNWSASFVYVGQILDLGYVLGLGLGSAGTALQFSSLAGSYIGYDNFALGVYMMFGVFGIILLFFLSVRAIRRAPPESAVLLACLLSYGITVQGFASTLFCIPFALLLGYAPARERQSDILSQSARTVLANSQRSATAT